MNERRVLGHSVGTIANRGWGLISMAGLSRSNTGRQLRREWNIPAQHVLYHHEGTWFHLLERFPGALCDPHGYVLFETKEDFFRSPNLKIGKHVRVPDGLRNVRGYVQTRR